MRRHETRLDRLEAHYHPELDALQAEPTTAEAERACVAKVHTWLERLAATMDEAHHALVVAWLEDFAHPCTHQPCPVPRGLARTLDTLVWWIDDPERPCTLPPAIVEVYLSHAPQETFPWIDGENGGYPLPVTGWYTERPIIHFPRCPICEGVTGWHAWDIKQQSPGYRGLKPYGER